MLLEGALQCVDNAESEEGRFLTNALRIGKSHSVPINKFSHFPSRNKALNRETTKEDEDFLEEHPTGF